MSTRRCPTCGRSFAVEQSDSLPFCCQRCKEIDLGRWLGEAYGFPLEPERDAEEPPDAGPADLGR